MSLFDKTKTKIKKSARQFMGIKGIGSNTLVTYTKGELVYFMVGPANISVLSPVNIETKIRQLMIILSSGYDIELCCLDSAECFDNNKFYLKRRMNEEKEPAVRRLLEQDYTFLDEIQIKSSTARDFMFIARFKKETEEQLWSAINRIEKTIKNQGFEVHRAGKEEIKRLLAIYFENNTTSERIRDFDGDKWAELIDKEMITDV